MRIGSNSWGADYSAVMNLNKAYQQLTKIGALLSTGRRINRAADDPAGMIALASLQSDLTTIRQSSQNAAYAQYSMDLADSGMSQVQDLMNTIRRDVVAAANGTLSDQERAALQAEVDNALQAIDRIGENTRFMDQKLLDGSTLQFQISPEASGAVSIEMPDINTTALGGTAGYLGDLASGGDANLVNGNLEMAQAILDQAETQLLGGRIEVGAFSRYTLETASANSDSMEVGLMSAVSQLGDTDYAQAMSQLIGAQILAQSLFGVMKSMLETRGLVLDLLAE